MDSRSDWSGARVRRVRQLIHDLYRVVDELNREFASEGHRFTPDGHMVGSLGEVVAAYAFGLKLLPMSSVGHDAVSSDERFVQIKLTGGTRGIGLNSEPEHLIVLQLKQGREFRLVYNGPGAPVWARRGKRQKNGQWHVGLRTLEELNAKATRQLRQKWPFP